MAGSPANSHGNGYPLALAGAVAATRYVGGTTAAAPVAGTFAVGDFVIAQDGKLWVCTVAGAPGTWVQPGGGAPGGNAGGDLTGTYPNPTIANVALLTTKGDLLHASAAATAARLAVGTANQVLGVASGDVAWQNGGMVLLASSVLVSPAATFDFTSISAAYAHLKILFTAETSDASSQLMSVRFNNDSGSNYDGQFVNGAGALATAGEAFGQSAAPVVFVASSAVTPLAATGEIVFPWYSGTTFHKSLTSASTIKVGTSTGNIGFRLQASWWRSTAAISRVTLILAAGNFVTGSSVSLYGLV